METILPEIIIPLPDEDICVFEVSSEDVDCIIEALEGEASYFYWCSISGRPRKFETPEDIYDQAEEYFSTCKAINEPFTVTGLAMALGTWRDVLMDYEDGVYGPEFSEAIKHVKLRVENGYELRLFCANPTGAIFGLKNMGWRDTQEHELSGKGGAPIATVTTGNISDEALKALGDAIVNAKGSDIV